MLLYISSRVLVNCQIMLINILQLWIFKRNIYKHSNQKSTRRRCGLNNGLYSSGTGSNRSSISTKSAIDWRKVPVQRCCCHHLNPPVSLPSVISFSSILLLHLTYSLFQQKRTALIFFFYHHQISNTEIEY